MRIHIGVKLFDGLQSGIRSEVLGLVSSSGIVIVIGLHLSILTSSPYSFQHDRAHGKGFV